MTRHGANISCNAGLAIDARIAVAGQHALFGMCVTYRTYSVPLLSSHKRAYLNALCVFAMAAYGGTFSFRHGVATPPVCAAIVAANNCWADIRHAQGGIRSSHIASVSAVCSHRLR